MLDPTVLRQLRDYAARLDAAAPGVLAGLYAVGSVALGDFRPPLSNLDVVAVADGRWTAEQAGAAAREAGVLRRGRERPRVSLITWQDLAADPARVDAVCLEGRRHVPGDELANPLTWQVLRTAGVCVRGPEYPEIGAGDLRDWAAERLARRWGPWVRRNGNRPNALMGRRATTEGTLEVARLAQVVSSGRVVSKVEAGELALGSGVERFQRLLKDAVGFRRGQHMSMYWGPFERKSDVIAFIEAAAAVA